MTVSMQMVPEKSSDDRGAEIGERVYKYEAMEHFPWVPIGQTVIVYPAPDGIEQLSSGLFKVTGVTGGEKKRYGIVVAVGPGDFTFGVGFVSPSKHLDIHPKDIVTWNPESGIDWTIDGITYQQLMPDDIRARLKDALGLKMRRECMMALAAQLAKHADLGADAGQSSVEDTRPPIVRQDMDQMVGDETERQLANMGKATKVQVLVPGLKED